MYARIGTPTSKCAAPKSHRSTKRRGNRTDERGARRAARFLSATIRTSSGSSRIVSRPIASKSTSTLPTCAARIARVASKIALNTLDGVAQVRVNPAQRRVVLDYDPNRIGLRGIFEAIAAAGYTPFLRSARSRRRSFARGTTAATQGSRRCGARDDAGDDVLAAAVRGRDGRDERVLRRHCSAGRR